MKLSVLSSLLPMTLFEWDRLVNTNEPVDENEINLSFVEDDYRKNTVGSEENYCR